MTSVTVSEPRGGLPELLSRVELGEEVMITRHGRAVAVLVRPDTLPRRPGGEAFEGAETVSRLLSEAAKAPLPEEPGLTGRRAEELVRQIRAGRDDR